MGLEGLGVETESIIEPLTGLAFTLTDSFSVLVSTELSDLEIGVTVLSYVCLLLMLVLVLIQVLAVA